MRTWPLRPRLSGSRTRQITVWLFLLMASAQLALPLTPDQWRFWTPLVVCLMATVSFGVAADRVGGRRAAVLAAVVVTFSLVVEYLGTNTGEIFGDYSYLPTSGLGPAVFGVPIVVGLSWFSMAVPAHGLASRLASSGPARWMIGGLALMAWDLFLDPQMVEAGMWRWNSTTSPDWFGIPLTNYLGWFVVGSVLTAVVDHMIKHREASNDDAYLLYVWMAVTETLGFALPFAFDRPDLAVSGGVVMLGLCLWASARNLRMTLRSRSS